MLRPEVLGVMGLCLAALATLAIWLRVPRPGGGRPLVCNSCGTVQHNLSRTAALTHEFFGSNSCIACGGPLSKP